MCFGFLKEWEYMGKVIFQGKRQSKHAVSGGSLRALMSVNSALLATSCP